MPSFEVPFAKPLIEFLYPPACSFCGSALIEEDTHALCETCSSVLLGITEDLCNRCGAPIGPHASRSDSCRHCRRDRFAFQAVFPYGIYQDELRDACLRCKEAGNEALIQALTALLWESRRTELRNQKFDLIVPVPQHWRDRFWKSHNTSERIADSMSQRLGIPVARTLLRKTKWTPKQASQTGTARRKNLKGAFQSASRLVTNGKRILLVDDILTTGSTANACSRALKDAGSGEIFVAVLARGLG